MSRKVKCYVTGETGTNDTFVKIGSHYYKSQAVYDAYRHEIDTRKAIISIIAKDFLNYTDGQKFPPYIQTKLNELSFYSNDVILATIEKTKNSIIYYTTNKEFRNEAGKIAYIFAIIANNINDINKEYKAKLQSEKREHITELPPVSIAVSNTSAPKGKDISDWLEDEDI